MSIQNYNFPYREDTLYRYGNFMRRRIDYAKTRLEARVNSWSKIRPLKLYNIDPEEIEFNLKMGSRDTESKDFHPAISPKSNFPTSKRPVYDPLLSTSPVIDGDWDQKTEEIVDYDILRSLNRHFNDDIEWSETDFYSRALSSVENEEEWKGRGNLSTMDDLNQYLQRIDRLYESIISNGYKTQRELYQGLGSSFWTPNNKAFERHEVTVHVTRNGNFIIQEGWHRLATTRAIGLESIPVRISARHKIWQQKREEVLKTSKKYFDHPDLNSLKQQ
jgi:hypothetical protein